MQISLDYNIDQIVAVKGYGFSESSYIYVPEKRIKTWFGYVKITKEHIAHNIFDYTWEIDEFFKSEKHHVWGKNKTILRKPRIYISFSNKEDICIFYDTEEEMKKTLEGLLGRMKNVLNCKNF